MSAWWISARTFSRPLVVAFLLIAAVHPCIAATCPAPAATILDSPVRPHTSYSDEAGPFLDKVWFDGTTEGCNGGKGLLCPPSSDPETCAQPAQPGNCDYWKLHLGQDLNLIDVTNCTATETRNCDCGESVFAIGNGIVLSTSTTDSGLGFGKWALLQHTTSDGTPFFSFYG